MVKIDKTEKCPTILVSRGADKGKDKLLLETQKLKAEYLSDPAAYDSGKEIKFKSEVYGHKKIKSALFKAQHGKCCYCESHITRNKEGEADNENGISVSGGDVEHFRPKAAWTVPPSRKYNYPGYYWLAYDWENLFYACIRCNQRLKKNNFPLIDESQRALNHTYNIKNEEPLLIHPGKVDPEKHITFDKECITPKNDSALGEMTIKVLKLWQFDEIRKELHDKIKLLIDIYPMIPDQVPENEISKARVIKVLKESIAPNHQYLNMIKSNFGNEIQKILNDAV